jgi:hypothetical protein
MDGSAAIFRFRKPSQVVMLQMLANAFAYSWRVDTRKQGSSYAPRNSGHADSEDRPAGGKR